MLFFFQSFTKRYVPKLEYLFDNQYFQLDPKCFVLVNVWKPYLLPTLIEETTPPLQKKKRITCNFLMTIAQRTKGLNYVWPIRPNNRWLSHLRFILGLVLCNRTLKDSWINFILSLVSSIYSRTKVLSYPVL